LRFLRRAKFYTAVLLYYGLVSYLPYKIPGSRRFRSWLVHQYAPGVSPKAVINRRARIGAGAKIAPHAGVGEGSLIPSQVTLYPHVTMGPTCVFITGTHPVPPDGGYFRDMRPVHKPIVVEEDVFIGYGCTILPGVRIGRGAAVGAASVVSKDVPAGATVVGNPARVVKQRMPPSQDNPAEPSSRRELPQSEVAMDSREQKASHESSSG
jgi:maltose O-acetyltransferase